MKLLKFLMKLQELLRSGRGCFRVEMSFVRIPVSAGTYDFNFWVTHICEYTYCIYTEGLRQLLVVEGKKTNPIGHGSKNNVFVYAT